MAKKQFFIVLDTETSIKDKVADFGAVICDRKGTIYNSIGVLVGGVFGKEKLFYDKNAADLWGLAGLERRQEAYENMLRDGRRQLASVNAINKWLAEAVRVYDPEMTAYNIAFDKGKCKNTEIDLSIFKSNFCLWYAAQGVFAGRKDYRQFILDNHLFNTPTKLGNMTFQTNAEVMASYLAGKMLEDEPHTALEDARDYEVPILVEVIKRKKWREKMKAYNWRDYQVRENFQPK